jgi:hypothetical protein
MTRRILWDDPEAIWNHAVDEHVSYQITGDIDKWGWIWRSIKNLMGSCCRSKSKYVDEEV